jgi:hypothetical protein
MERTTNERLAVIEDAVVDIRHRLFGNGQPGILDKHDQRLDRLESYLWRGLGIMAFLMFAVGMYAALK